MRSSYIHFWGQIRVYLRPEIVYSFLIPGTKKDFWCLKSLNKYLLNQKFKIFTKTSDKKVLVGKKKQNYCFKLWIATEECIILSIQK